jgi:hypothetical protein
VAPGPIFVYSIFLALSQKQPEVIFSRLGLKKKKKWTGGVAQAVEFRSASAKS